MRKESKQEALHKDGLMMVRHQIRQLLLGQNGEELSGEVAATTCAGILKSVMGYSGITTNEARETLKGKNGPYLDTVRKAIELIEKEEEEKKKKV